MLDMSITWFVLIISGHFVANHVDGNCQHFSFVLKTAAGVICITQVA